MMSRSSSAVRRCHQSAENCSCDSLVLVLPATAIVSSMVMGSPQMQYGNPTTGRQHPSAPLCGAQDIYSGETNLENLELLLLIRHFSGRGHPFIDQFLVIVGAIFRQAFGVDPSAMHAL